MEAQENLGIAHKAFQLDVFSKAVAGLVSYLHWKGALNSP